MKKIIISTYDDIRNPNYGGGGAIAIHELAKRLKNIYDIQVISWNHSGIKNEDIDGVKYKRIGFVRLNPKLGMLLFQLSLPFIAISNKCDLWLESFAPPFTTAFLPLFTKKQVVGIVHMLAAEDMVRKYGKLPFRFLEKAGMKLYKHIITTNEYTKKKILALNPDARVEVISNGIEKVSSLKTKKTKNILFLGRIEIDQKGLDLLLPAFRKFLHEGNTEYKLIIAGSGSQSEMKKLLHLIKANNLKKNVVLKGWVEGKEKNKLLDRASAIVIPSRFETYSMVALEAMAHGLPIVCFDIDGLKWLNKKVAVKVSLFDTHQLAEAIKTVVSNINKTNEIKKYGPSYASRFTWDKIAQKYHKYIGGQLANV